MKIQFFTSNAAQTSIAGQALAAEILKTKFNKKAFVVGLVGELASGKTTFLQGFAQGLGLKNKILSPTFIIMRRVGHFYHIDCYRIKNPKEMLALGFKKIIANPKNIIAVEWADRIRKIMPVNTIWVEFELLSEKKRRIVVK